MKKPGKIKLNRLSKAEMEKRELNNLRGGDCCGCGCHYSGGGGGSNSYDNLNANQKYGYHSYGGDIGCSTAPGPGTKDHC